jgi:hypothetical protein
MTKIEVDKKYRFLVVLFNGDLTAKLLVSDPSHVNWNLYYYHSSGDVIKFIEIPRSKPHSTDIYHLIAKVKEIRIASFPDMKNCLIFYEDFKYIKL